jgi:acyl-CoA synthetase (AMP-forming)/AMP-acid ligase II
VEEGSRSPALESAAELGIQVLWLAVDEGVPAGVFRIHGGRQAGGGTAGGDSGAGVGDGPDDRSDLLGGPADPDDVALVLHTSGTTSRPKIVPLLQRNICASSGNIGTTLRLTSDDRCMNVMPLFHIHGLMAPVLSSLRAGASVHCTPGFNALRFFAWMDEVRPTWYSAVPTMHQAILSRAPRNHHVIAATPLRLIRSSSSSLPPQVMKQVEETFGVPLVEAYAMTEASHQMTCNPLPPGVRKPGSVGIAAGPEVAIMDAEGRLLEPGQVGEIVIRGPNVTSGYENNPEANATAFTDGWFRTGDQGVMDADGYVSLTGRLKEIINRGGEKISPKEVDLVILDHPAVHQVVTFALPHPKLGEEVAAAVVLAEGQEASPAEIREYAAGRLADFKVPRKVLILDEIPKGPTGKLRRIGLAEQLGLTE